MAIERLSLTDAMTAAMYFAVSLQDQDYRLSASDILAYMQANLTAGDNKITQYAAPSASGFSVSITDSSNSIWLVLTPVAGYASGTIVLPALANCVDKQEILVNCTQSVTALTINGNGSTVTGAPTTLTSNEFFTLRFEDVTNTWYRVS
jgi:hypothetical protein